MATRSSQKSGDDKRHFALFFARRLHFDFNVLAESGKKIEQAAYGKVSGAVAEQSRNMGLGDADDFTNFFLRQVAGFDDAIDLQRQTGFHQFLLGKPSRCTGPHLREGGGPRTGFGFGAGGSGTLGASPAGVDLLIETSHDVSTNCPRIAADLSAFCVDVGRYANV